MAAALQAQEDRRLHDFRIALEFDHDSFRQIAPKGIATAAQLTVARVDEASPGWVSSSQRPDRSVGPLTCSALGDREAIMARAPAMGWVPAYGTRKSVDQDTSRRKWF